MPASEIPSDALGLDIGPESREDFVRRIRAAKTVSSANSINLGRLLPQMVSYANASLAYHREHGVAPGFIVPSGNVGNALAGLWAKKLGMPIREMVLATNANPALTDYLNGGEAGDVLDGGAGNDTYVLGRGHAAETITDNDSTSGNTDVASFLSGVSTDQIWFRRVSNNLEVSIIGTSDRITVASWYTSSAYQLEQFKTADGKTLTSSKVATLVTAMWAFTPPTSGQTTGRAASFSSPASPDGTRSRFNAHTHQIDKQPCRPVHRGR